MSAQRPLSIIVADPNAHTLNLAAEVLRFAGYDNIIYARDGQQLLDLTVEREPRIVITTSRLPVISGLEFTRLIRAGYGQVARTLSIIVMTDTPTKAFLTAARESGADEMLVRPFAAKSLLVRVKAVLDNPRPFVESTSYVGPSRRRRMVDDYDGPLRRFIDPTDDTSASPWESEPNRIAVRNCVKKISEIATGLTAGDRKKLREIYTVTKETEAFADDTRDAIMGAAARSLGRYIMAIGAAGQLDAEVIGTHIDAMHTLSMLGNDQHEARQKMAEGLVRVVDKKLKRPRAA